MLKRIVLPALAAFAAATLQAAVAGQMPGYATAEETIQGTVASINGSDLSLQDVRGFLDHVVLRGGTVVNPSGLQMSPGLPVTIRGHADGRIFVAVEIDSAEQDSSAPGGYSTDGYSGDQYAPDPYPVAYPAYPYPYYAPYYGPFFGTSVDFFFGGSRFHDRGFNHGFGGRGFAGHGFSGHGVGGGFTGRGFSSGGSAGRGFVNNAVVGHSVAGHSSGSARGSSGRR